MKYLKESKINVVKWSDMDGWSKPEVYQDLDELPKEMNDTINRVLSTLYENGLAILGIDRGEFFKNVTMKSKGDTWGLFQSEKKLTEYRVTLGKVIRIQDIEYQWGASTIEEYDEKYDESSRDDFIDALKSVGQVEDIKDQDLSFSVFAPNAKMSPELKALIIINAIKYLGMLIKNAKDSIILGRINRTNNNIFDSHIEDMKGIFREMKEELSVDNMEKLPDLSYRLYKDSKFFREFSDFKGSDKIMMSVMRDIFQSFKE